MTKHEFSLDTLVFKLVVNQVVYGLAVDDKLFLVLIFVVHETEISQASVQIKQYCFFKIGITVPFGATCYSTLSHILKITVFPCKEITLVRY